MPKTLILEMPKASRRGGGCFPLQTIGKAHLAGSEAELPQQQNFGEFLLQKRFCKNATFTILV